MNISYNWLKKYIAADLSAEAMATILTDIGLEVESFEKIETVRHGYVRRAKLYYLRDRVGKAAKIKEKAFN